MVGGWRENHHIFIYLLYLLLYSSSTEGLILQPKMLQLYKAGVHHAGGQIFPYLAISIGTLESEVPEVEPNELYLL